MRTVWTLMIVALLAVCSTSSALAKDAGEDTGPNTDETPFSSYTATSPSVSGDTWSLTVVMDQDVKDRMKRLQQRLQS
mgnify:CR=1 FL=1